MRMAASVVERAFQVAGSCATIDEIRRRLRAEGYAQVDAHLGGRMIRRELKGLLREELEAPSNKKEAGGFTPAPIA
jgi:hypothetical protein